MSENTESIPTRQSLLSRLKDWKDQESWRVFFNTYWNLIYHTGRRAGLTDSEAQDLVQETMLCVLKGRSGQWYDSKKGSFKNWLLRLTGWRIADQLRRRGRLGAPGGRPGSSGGTATLERVVDPSGLKLETLWEEEWKENLLGAAVRRIKSRIDPKHYQAFDLYVRRNWPVSKVSKTLGISPAKVYLIKHRIQHLIKQEISCLRDEGY